jgi:hypothetical protein
MSFRIFDITPGVSVAQLEETAKVSAVVDRFLRANYAFIHQEQGIPNLLAVSSSDSAERHITSIKRLYVWNDDNSELPWTVIPPEEDISRWMAL